MTKVYDKAVRLTLSLYEGWILPSSFIRNDLRPLKDLRQAKIDEFDERKKLLNPYLKEKMLEEGKESEVEMDRLKYLSKITKMDNMKTF